MLAIWQEWLEFAIRWLHVVTGIAWIGSSFYFIALDLGLRKPPGLPPGVSGESWQVHGGGFYQLRKFSVAPDDLPDHLIWFKWESYATWLSGFALMCVVYYLGAELFLIDAAVLPLEPWQAVCLSLAVLAGGWIVYDGLCRSPLGANSAALGLLLLALSVALSYGLTHLFSGRGAYIHMGALTATIMTANVFLVIIPNQKKVVADLRAGRTPDPALGEAAKLRSTHNNYLTLPVIFLMISNHYPLAFATRYNWLIVALVVLIGILIRHYFNTVHAGGGQKLWTWFVAAALFVVIVWLSTLGPANGPPPEASSGAVTLAEAHEIVSTRCSMCHAAEPLWDGVAAPPKGVVLESEEDVARHARQIFAQAGVSSAMPPGNVSFMEPSERAALRSWFEGGATR
ncbi:MAG: urate hydroxylase PuuD [Flavobacteriaceae bacterium]